MILNLDDQLHPELLEKAIAFFNDPSAQGEKIVYLSSTGGHTHIAEVLKDLFESHKVHLIGYGRIESSAFDLFFTVNCEKRLISNVLGMAHQSYITVEMGENNKPCYKEGVAFMKHIKGYGRRHSEHIMDTVEFTTKERKQFLAGDDVFFSTERMQEMLVISENKRKKTITA